MLNQCLFNQTKIINHRVINNIEINAKAINHNLINYNIINYNLINTCPINQTPSQNLAQKYIILQGETLANFLFLGFDCCTNSLKKSAVKMKTPKLNKLKVIDFTSESKCV